MRTLYLLAGAFALSLAGSASADPMVDGDAEAGEANSTACAACHGPDGNSSNPEWPKLAGQHAKYTYEQLKAYKSGERDDAVMMGQVQNLDDQDMKDLAVFYAQQVPQVGSADEELGEAGKKIYRGGNLETGVTACIACHGPRGEGVPMANYPMLSGQHAQYTIEQLEAYRDGERSTDRAGMMRDIAARMSDEEIEAVAEYIQGLY
ncbi:cytochrome c553 [Natronospira proteinivora]|uniref:Cytochrome c553 n=1 Tax=Natronospira proteinivora TaxID=1807133 RepID=A0ABT1GA55_9GAMM|nr:c-type cytochrome [Natronospira proteinivora]MCP1728146.1 cytochrome c553 [Natronospira proteinivora]